MAGRSDKERGERERERERGGGGREREKGEGKKENYAGCSPCTWHSTKGHSSCKYEQQESFDQASIINRIIFFFWPNKSNKDVRKLSFIKGKLHSKIITSDRVVYFCRARWWKSEIKMWTGTRSKWPKNLGWWRRGRHYVTGARHQVFEAAEWTRIRPSIFSLIEEVPNWETGL